MRSVFSVVFSISELQKRALPTSVGIVALLSLVLVLVPVRASEPDPAAKLLSDAVHPADQGHKLYADAIMSFLSERIVRDTSAKNMPPPLKENPAEPNVLGDQKAAALGTGWKVDARALGFMPTTLTVADPAKGAEMTTRFTGSVMGIYWLQTFDGGQLEWSVDGQPPQRLISGADIFVKRHTMALNFDRLKATFPYGEHKLTIRASSEKPPGSLGTVIKIGAIVTQ